MLLARLMCMGQNDANTITSLPPNASDPAATPTNSQPSVATLVPDSPLPDDPDILKRMINELLQLLHARDRQLNGVQQRLDQLLRRLYGPKSEKLRPDQPRLFELPATTEPTPETPSVPAPINSEPVARKRKKGHGRRPLPADLRRERVVYDVPEAQKVCDCCQTPRVKIGEEVSEQLDYQPAKLFVRQHVRLKYACPNCAKAASKVLPTPLPSTESPEPTTSSSADSSTTPASLTPTLIESTVADQPTESPESATPMSAADSTTTPASLTPDSIESTATDQPAESPESASPSPAAEVSMAPAALSTDSIGSTVVVIADKPAQPIDKGVPGPGLLAFVITSKYADHLPLYRQMGILGRLGGVEISLSTLCGWMAASANLLRLLYDDMLKDVLLSKVVQTDETRLPVLDKEKDKTKSGRLWTLVGDRDHPHTIYFYTPTRVRDGPAAILQNYKGYLQADASNVFDEFFVPGDMIEVGCWAHARRYFHESKTSDAARAAEGLARIGFFYEVEREAKAIVDKQELNDDQADTLRLKMRQERTLPKLKEFKLWIDEQAKVVLPKCPIAQAINYVTNHWEALLRFTEHGFLNIDNNASERALRPGALGRKNWLFAGSDEGGHTAAVLYSFTQTCRRHGIDPFAYLQDVLNRLPRADYQDLADLFPRRWALAQRAKAENPA